MDLWRNSRSAGRGCNNATEVAGARAARMIGGGTRWTRDLEEDGAKSIAGESRCARQAGMGCCPCEEEDVVVGDEADLSLLQWSYARYSTD